MATQTKCQMCENVKFGSSSGSQHSIVVVALCSSIIANHEWLFFRSKYFESFKAIVVFKLVQRQ